MESKSEERVRITLSIGGMSCASCAQGIENKLNKTRGVIKASVNLLTEKAVVEYNPKLVKEEDIEKIVDDLGYKVLSRSKPEKVRYEQKQVGAPASSILGRRPLGKLWCDYSKYDPSRAGMEARACLPQLRKIASSNLPYRDKARRLADICGSLETRKGISGYIGKIFKKAKEKVYRLNELAHKNKDCIGLASILNYLEWFGFSIDLDSLVAKREDLTLELIIEEKSIKAVDKKKKEVYAEIEL
jgi:copper chaperone CopZ